MPDQYQNEEDISIIDYIKVVYKWRKMIAAIVIVSTFVAGALSLSQPKEYEASATFFPLSIEDYTRRPGLFTVEQSLKADQLVIVLLESRKMAERIVEQLELKKLWKAKLSVDAANILRGISTIALGRNGIITLSVHTTSPQLSAQIANAYVANLEDFNSELKLGAQREIVRVIDKAVVPEKRMARGTVRKTMMAAVVSLLLAALLAFLIDFFQKNNILTKLKEMKQ